MELHEIPFDYDICVVMANPTRMVLYPHGWDAMYLLGLDRWGLKLVPAEIFTMRLKFSCVDLSVYPNDYPITAPRPTPGNEDMWPPNSLIVWKEDEDYEPTS